MLYQTRDRDGQYVLWYSQSGPPLLEGSMGVWIRNSPNQLALAIPEPVDGIEMKFVTHEEPIVELSVIAAIKIGHSLVSGGSGVSNYSEKLKRERHLPPASVAKAVREPNGD